MVSLPLHGEIQAVYGNNMVYYGNKFVVIGIYMGLTYRQMGHSTYVQKQVGMYAYLIQHGTLVDNVYFFSY